MDRWRDGVLAYHVTGGSSNGRVENVHMLAERIRRHAHGLSTTTTTGGASSDDSASNGLPFIPTQQNQRPTTTLNA
jgi:hypothetical protein